MKKKEKTKNYFPKLRDTNYAQKEVTKRHYRRKLQLRKDAPKLGDKVMDMYKNRRTDNFIKTIHIPCQFSSEKGHHCKKIYPIANIPFFFASGFERLLCEEHSFRAIMDTKLIYDRKTMKESWQSWKNRIDKILKQPGGEEYIVRTVVENTR
jgi:hypothetical protein